jgi:hypothetical protein
MLLPEWLLEQRWRSEAALISVVATGYLLRVSTRRMEKLVETEIGGSPDMLSAIIAVSVARRAAARRCRSGHRPQRRLYGPTTRRTRSTCPHQSCSRRSLPVSIDLLEWLLDTRDAGAERSHNRISPPRPR